MAEAFAIYDGAAVEIYCFMLAVDSQRQLLSAMLSG